MAVGRIDLSGIVVSLPGAAPPLRVTLPGGVVVSGTPHQLGATAMEQVRATLGAVNAALAPLAPVFTIIEAMLALKKFVEAVPGILADPGKVVNAAKQVVEKIGGLATLVPQLSIPLTVLGVVDAMLALLGAIVAELQGIVQQAQRIEDARAAATEAPELLRVIAGADEQLRAQQGNLAQSLAALGPVLDVLNTFAQIAGLPPLSLDADMTGDAASALASIQQAISALKDVRNKIPF